MKLWEAGPWKKASDLCAWRCEEIPGRSLLLYFTFGAQLTGKKNGHF